ncbi:MAG TPA: hypothetical protein PKV53_12385 [Anaerohalosphaeraceae bacterium]|nr:hypothetical protein [Anaerohalosphaeraceae bacterium]
MQTQPNMQTVFDKALRLAIVGLAAWVVPGAGHWLIGERKRAVILFAVIAGLFITGLYVGSIGVVDWVSGRIWFYAQILCSPAVGILGSFTKNGRFPTYGRPCDIGQIYTGIAGLLNLLSILSAVYMAYCGRGELIGREEDNE